MCHEEKLQALKFRIFLVFGQILEMTFSPLNFDMPMLAYFYI